MQNKITDNFMMAKTISEKKVVLAPSASSSGRTDYKNLMSNPKKIQRINADRLCSYYGKHGDMESDIAACLMVKPK